jgi:alanyl-tRNA synthetase
MADRGVLAGLAVRDVQMDEAGRVHHVLDAPAGTEGLPTAGTEVTGEIDRARRRVHMALHTGQHMLSRALEDEAGAATVSSRLGESGCTIDTDRVTVDERAIARAEDLVNAVVDDDVRVRAFFPSPDELAALPLRRPPKVKESIRVVEVTGFDVTPCGGTHCTASGQVGLVRVTGVERYKGKTRIGFAAGSRARQELWAHSDLLRSLSEEFTCGPLDVRAAIERLRREGLSAKETLGRVRGRLAEAIADGLLATREARVVASIDEADPELLRAVATRLLTGGAEVALLGGRTADGVHALVARREGSSFECGTFLRKLATAAGGRGGGRPDRAEGRLPPDAAWDALVRAALAE